MELLQKIEKINKITDELNDKSKETKAQKRLLEEQLQEKVNVYSEKYGIKFPSISSEAEFSAFVSKLIAEEENRLTAEAERAEKVIELVNSGNISEARALLEGVSSVEEEIPLGEESGIEDFDKPVPQEEVEAVKARMLAESDDLKEEDDLDLEDVLSDKFNLDDLDIEDEVVEEVKPTVEEVKPAVEKAPTVGFDMGNLDEEEVEVKPRRRRRRRVAIEEEDDVASPLGVSSANPVKSSGVLDFD